jgi:antitoxin component YwqK of YwqJK toxin-antitoxin module
MIKEDNIEKSYKKGFCRLKEIKNCLINFLKFISVGKFNSVYYKNGKRDSIYRLYDEIGCKLIAEESYAEGNKHGLFIKYGFKGDTLSVETWQEGEREGRYAEWRDREIETTGMYLAGERHGYWKHGFSSHYQMREGTYNKGITTGEWRFYDDKGRLLAIQWYNDDGEEIKSKFFKKRK